MTDSRATPAPAEDNKSYVWVPWALGEGGIRAFNTTLVKAVGLRSGTFGLVLLSTGIIGMVQVTLGLSVAKKQGISLFPETRLILWSIAFGVLATICTALAFTIYSMDGDIAVHTVIIATAIVPGALIDWGLFRNRLSALEWLGVGLAVLAPYCMLNFPSLADIADLPLWVWLSVINMLLVAMNQGVTQAAKDVHPMVKNVWGGGATVLLTIPLVLLMGSWVDIQSSTFWILNITLGLGVVGLWTANVMSYKSGAKIAFKKLVVTGVYMTLAALTGILFFQEAATFGKLVGVLLFLLASYCMQQGEKKRTQ